MIHPRGIPLVVSACAAMIAASAAIAADVLVPQDEPTIQDAIFVAKSGDVVIVAPGTYVENLVLKSDVDVRGEEAARTFLASVDTSPAVLANGVGNVLFANFTIINATIGVSVIGASSSVQVANNVFDTVSDTGVVTEIGSAVEVLNNVFFNNETGVSRGGPATKITNNIFSENTTTILSVGGFTNIDHNCYFENDNGSGIGANAVTANPLFVSIGLRDFHLQEGNLTPGLTCIDAGAGPNDIIDDTIADTGAYGGPFADVRPYPVPQPSASDTSADPAPPYNITLTWDRNLAYLVTNTTDPGGYFIYYRQNQPGPPWNGSDAGGGANPSRINAGDVETYTLTNLTPVVPPPVIAPNPVSAGGLFESVRLTWPAVLGASSYRVYYGEINATDNPVDVGNTTTFTVGGLQNGVTYKFQVSAFSQPTYYMAVSAYDSVAPVPHESVLSDTETLSIGPRSEGPLSNEVTATPSVTVPYPNLPDKGCFVATAAFGADWAPEVEVLRDFRDLVLLRSRAGRAFIDWYYRYGPAAAEFIDGREILKPVVRAMLAPVVALALIALHASNLQIAAVLILLLALIAMRRRATS